MKIILWIIVLAAGFWQFGAISLRSTNQVTDMEKRIAICMYEGNVEEFCQALKELKDDYPQQPSREAFNESLLLAKGFSASGEAEYVEYLEQVARLRPELLTAYDDCYGQPLFRQIFRNGSEKSLEYYLDLPAVKENGKPVTTLLQDARKDHEFALDQLKELREIKFEPLRMFDYMCVDDEEAEFYDTFAEDDPRFIICQLNTVVRQRRMLKMMEEQACD